MLGPGQALSGRYQVFSQLWWIALLVIGAQVVALLLRRETDQGQARRPIFFATAVLVLVAGAGLIRSNVMARQYVDAVRTVQTRDQVCVLAYSLAPDTCLQEYFSPSADFVRSAAPYLRRQHLALFDGATVSGPLQALPAPPTVRVTIDTTNGRIPARYPYPPTTLRARAPIALTGWAADTQTLSPLRDFLIDVDERTDVRVTSRVARPDVAAALGQPSYLRSGYRATIPGSLVTPGAHLIGIKVVGPGGRASFVPSATVEIVAR
jgi:hypothetical protein